MSLFIKKSTIILVESILIYLLWQISRNQWIIQCFSWQWCLESIKVYSVTWFFKKGYYTVLYEAISMHKCHVFEHISSRLFYIYSIFMLILLVSSICFLMHFCFYFNGIVSICIIFICLYKIYDPHMKENTKFFFWDQLNLANMICIILGYLPRRCQVNVSQESLFKKLISVGQ